MFGPPISVSFPAWPWIVTKAEKLSPPVTVGSISARSSRLSSVMLTLLTTAALQLTTPAATEQSAASAVVAPGPASVMTYWVAVRETVTLLTSAAVAEIVS